MSYSVLKKISLGLVQVVYYLNPLLLKGVIGKLPQIAKAF